MKTFKQNLSEAVRHISTWWVTICTGAVAYWMQLDPESQRVVLDAAPWLKYTGLAVSFVLFIIAKGIPQKVGEEP